MSNVEEDGQEGSDREEEDAGESDSELDVKPQPNQAVLEDDQIQANQDEKAKDKEQNTQANLKQKEEGKKPQQDASK